MLAQLLILIGIALNTIGTFVYFLAVLKGKVKPNKVTYVLWALAPSVAFLAQIQQGVGVQSLMTLSVCLLPLSIFVASFFSKKAYWKIKTFDLLCGSLSLIGLILWYITQVGNIAILFSILADGLASLPTITKAYRYPETEWALPWVGSVASGVLTLVTIKDWNFQSYGFPLYYTIAMFAIFFFAATKVGKRKKPAIISS